MILDDKGNEIQFGYWGAKPQWRRNQDAIDHTSILQTEERVLNQNSRKQLLSTLRDLERNSCICKAIVETFVSNVGKCSLVSHTQEDEYDKQREKYFERYFRKLEISGNGINHVIQCVVTDLLLSGEIFIILTRGSSVQLVSSERCCSSSHKSKRKNNESDGLVFDRFGNIKQYRFSKIKDGVVDEEDGIYINAKDVIHVKNITRTGQHKGSPMLSSACQTILDIHSVQTAFTSKVRASSALVGFITSNQPYSEKFNFNEFDDEPMRSTYTKIPQSGILLLENGESVQTLQGGNIDGVDKFLNSLIQFACASVGITFENLVGWSNASFSSSKATRAVTNHRFNLFREFFEDNLLRRICTWKSYKAQNENDLPVLEDENQIDEFSFNWNKASSLDRRQDAQTDALMIDKNLSSLTEVFANNGKDFETESEQIIKDKARLKELSEKYGMNNDEDLIQ